MQWGLGIGDWGLGLGPIPNPQSPLLIGIIRNYLNFVVKLFKLFKNIKNSINN